jgi:SWI/SNF-related matrix-associated actin-dependent regulator 1 of chromatin subfamily A
VTETDVQDDPTLQAIDDKYNYLLHAYQMTGTAKIKGTVEFLDTLIENKVKFLVFAHHYEVMDGIEDSIVRRKVSYIRVDGQLEASKRYEAVRKFQNDPNVLVAILALTASSQGITLTAASTVVFAEMNWTPGIMVQAEDRAHRIGQVQSVNVYYLFGENTVDAMIYPRLKLKSEVFANILDGKQTEFKIDGEDNTEQLDEARGVNDEKLAKDVQREDKLINKSLNQEDISRF